MPEASASSQGDIEDIVERLRHTAAHFERVAKSSEEKSHAAGIAIEMVEAANEIERLRAEDDLCHKAADEIERLRAENETLRGNHAGADEYEAAQDEIERLRREHRQEIAQQDGEIELLRAALVDIADYYKREFREGEKAYQAVIVASQALEPQ